MMRFGSPGGARPATCPISQKPIPISAGGDVIPLNMSDTDLELLARYTRGRAEDDFAEVVRRYPDLVHSAALCQVRSPQRPRKSSL